MGTLGIFIFLLSFLLNLFSMFEVVFLMQFRGSFNLRSQGMQFDLLVNSLMSVSFLPRFLFIYDPVVLRQNVS